MRNSRKNALSVAISLATMVSVGHAFAQDNSSENKAAESDTLEEITVTGSRIKRSEYETTQPSTSFDNSFIAESGFTNISDAINSMPMVQASGTSLAESSSSNVGQTFADLYGLGSQRTLTVMNGRRVVSANAPTARWVSADTRASTCVSPRTAGCSSSRPIRD